ncbi:hypothetical protein, conserved [Trypanosoma brucei brucei TREU927]|uniref:Uncharacterized protein n=1 Tax=Trypanosoma brucei brucei (strain 927/4 GUTat10.1) TaxID=185431 RepID=Q38D42_TRYB2|nr:hypothetical protein, conserved [Trypanosoma brucei brucei TREU927]EAN77278.1 hypothetical protein, conserved [Trypanosoma brucei brucei TREU927]
MQCNMKTWIILVTLSFFSLVVTRAVVADCIPEKRSTLTSQCPSLPLVHHFHYRLARRMLPSSLFCSALCQKPWSSFDEQSLRLEMEQWIRANRTVGMFPEAHNFVMDEVLRLTNNLEGIANDTEDVRTVYAKRVKETYQNMPWLMVKPGIIAQATEYYAWNVRGRHIVRAINLEEQDSEPEQIAHYVQAVREWWLEAQAAVARDRHVGPPYIPWVDLERLIGPHIEPPVLFSSSNSTGTHNQSGKSNIGLPREFFRRRSYPYLPPPLVTPPALVYYYSDNCKRCRDYNIMFDLLPFLYRRLCEHGHMSVVSCSPVLMLFRAKAPRSQLLVPRIRFYGVPCRLEVIHIAPTVKVFASELPGRRFCDPLESVEITIGSQKDIESMLVSLFIQLIRLDVINMRVVTKDALDDMKREEEEEERNDKQRERLTKGGNLSNGTKEKGNNTNSKRQRKASFMTLRDGIRELLRSHVNETWGGGADILRAADEVTWMQVYPMWFNISVMGLVGLWAVLLLWRSYVEPS